MTASHTMQYLFDHHELDLNPIPETYICALSAKIMDLPVKLPNGTVVDLASLKAWWTGNPAAAGQNPYTREQLTPDTVVFQKDLNEKIARFVGDPRELSEDEANAKILESFRPADTVRPARSVFETLSVTAHSASVMLFLLNGLRTAISPAPNSPARSVFEISAISASFIIIIVITANRLREPPPRVEVPLAETFRTLWTLISSRRFPGSNDDAPPGARP